ncbi:hypothetical protein Kpol_1011p6 [Vanderwaltozyma polyspora DSM 70294]|uniref:F-box domain-containing protein n=1 Tax=Vanderwaltozyma polyspora (strain ATCC 22028 / DSM 70294 / BCRC 21397 / CBS 2163 / NBRC 10782 / NRRL Y-8283 / UCD 57-17) TaxID=436907 RepID=A7TQW3_VANPO|nr:uncharacterized protein Kpol_1011p6 [Vanderwaltozyma polyspora DSM 70294]EDO15336.1 hypothetical protein Kpol_1011p6 [Vanderwaltozyma polyspora DSM 70294]
MMETSVPPEEFPLKGIPIPFRYQVSSSSCNEYHHNNRDSKKRHRCDSHNGIIETSNAEERCQNNDERDQVVHKRSKIDTTNEKSFHHRNHLYRNVILASNALATPSSTDYIEANSSTVLRCLDDNSTIEDENVDDLINTKDSNNNNTTKDLVNTNNVTNVNTSPISGNTIIAAATASEILTDEALLPSPVASPNVTTPVEETASLQGHMSTFNPDDQYAIPDNVSLISRLYTDELFREMQNNLSGPCFKNVLFQLLAKMNRRDLSDLGTLIKDNLKRDFITSLPTEVALKILANLKFPDLVTCSQVCKVWNNLANNTPTLWKQLLISENFVSPESFKKYSLKLLLRYPKIRNIEEGYRLDFIQNCKYLKNWYNPNFVPKITTLRGHITSVITCLQFEDDYVITGADDKMIRVIDAKKKKFLLELSGHDGGVWALKYDEDGILVSGSTDRTVRVWDIKRGCCTHVFKGHTSTVRCLDIVEYKNVKYIVTGSRDNTLHVWKLPRESSSTGEDPSYPLYFNSPEENPYFVGILRGHMASVRTVSGHGNIVISGSYDNNLMVWDIAQMKCLYILTGHTDRIYCTIYDHKRRRCISASMDSSIRIWNLENISKNGTCTKVINSMTSCINIIGSMYTLQGHTALVGLLKLSNKFLVSAAADGSLRGWDSNEYTRKFAYHHGNLSAITTFDMNDNILVSGSEGQFNIYNLRSGKLIHSNILRNADQIWSVHFKENILVAAIEKDGQSFVELLDFDSTSHAITRDSIPVA